MIKKHGSKYISSLWKPTAPISKMKNKKGPNFAVNIITSAYHIEVYNYNRVQSTHSYFIYQNLSKIYFHINYFLLLLKTTSMATESRFKLVGFAKLKNLRP